METTLYHSQGEKVLIHLSIFPVLNCIRKVHSDKLYLCESFAPNEIIMFSLVHHLSRPGGFNMIHTVKAMQMSLARVVSLEAPPSTAPLPWRQEKLIHVKKTTRLGIMD